MPEFHAVHISPNGKEDNVREGLYLYPCYENGNGEKDCDIAPISRYSRVSGYDTLPLGAHQFESKKELKENLRHGCRFASSEREVVEPPITSRCDLPHKEREDCIELQAQSVKGVCSVGPVSREESREIVFSLAATVSEK